jgi:ribose transport system substrate-binding protein
MTRAVATRERLSQCPGCEVVEFSNTPLAEAPQRQPQLITSWIQKYGTPLYVTAIADFTLDFQVPALKAVGLALVIGISDLEPVGICSMRNAAVVSCVTVPAARPTSIGSMTLDADG